MLVDCIVTGPFQENTYLVAKAEGEPCVVIDPGDEADRIAARIEELRLTPEIILNTHGHLDHIGAVPDLRDRYEIPFAIHPLDGFLLENVEAHAQLFGLSGYRDPEVDRDLVAGETVEAAGLKFEVVFTPGHSPGHVTFLLDGLAFAGDCLFLGSIGRSDLPRGDPAVLKRTLHEVFLSWPDATRVLPGHGPDTTIGEERRTNPFLTGAYPW
ncbi:MAG: MBL fold metallo-hydrolase [Planctomycetota bacterium]|jgi:glyoxylase-like metal-dependent hydrolase (beta-lactamase superfamily II)